MADDNTIIEGTVKFRDGKKWKSRWCVMRRLSPVADCVHLQLYRDSKARWGGATSKASLSLQHYLGCESGFTLDKHSNTLALICRDFVAVIAFETRERLIQWQVKVCAQLGSARQYMVLVGSGSAGAARGLRAGPARLLLLGQRAALTAGVPPRLLGLWELPHLRRYGVVEGRFCFEGGSLCGKGEGLHVLITDQAKELAHDFDLASQGRLSPNRRPFNTKKSDGAGSLTTQKAYRPNMKLSELNTVDSSLPSVDFRLYEHPCVEEAAAISPYWPSTERLHSQDMGLGDTASVNESTEATDTLPWNGAGKVTLERCMSCMSKLGALSRSSTAVLTPGAKHFNPAWTMESVQESSFKNYYVNNKIPAVESSEEIRHNLDRPPDRPPKPTSLELTIDRNTAVQNCNCSRPSRLENTTKSGPYENYDVPKLPLTEIEGEYYDTPKRLKECFNDDLFQMTKSSTSSTVILKKPCGCLLKFGKRRKHPTVIDTEETIQPTGCPCRRVTDWANNWIKLPYCRRTAASTDDLVLNKENLTPDDRVGSALYATIDLSRKTKRKMQFDSVKGEEGADDCTACVDIDSRTAEIDEGPLANYENLNFALSLEHYENAKDLLLSAGVTRSELDALRNNLKLCEVPPRLVPAAVPAPAPAPTCSACGGAVSCALSRTRRAPCNDDYLTMEPNSKEGNKLERSRLPPAGYTPMSPLSGFALQAKCPAAGRLLDEKSASNPALGTPEPGTTERRQSLESRTCAEQRKRSSSADSSRFLEDGDESEGAHSSAETLRGVTASGDGVTEECGCAPDKNSDADSSEASKGCIGASVPGNRDSSSSNDSGVSSCSARHSFLRPEFELPATTCAARHYYRRARRVTGRRALSTRRSRSTDALEAERGEASAAKSSSAEAEVPVLQCRPLRGVVDTHSTSSGTSDMSDYIETLSICSSHSSTDTPITLRVVRQTTSTLRPRSGNEYQNVDARLTAACRAPPPRPHPRPHPRPRPRTPTLCVERR